MGVKDGSTPNSVIGMYFCIYFLYRLILQSLVLNCAAVIFLLSIMCTVHAVTPYSILACVHLHICLCINVLMVPSSVCA